MSACLLFDAHALAQERGIELQGGAGYVFDPGEGPSVPSVNAGVIGWLTPGWGFGVRLAEGLTDERRDSVPDENGNKFLGPGDLRMWAITSQWRWFAQAFEVNVGVGAGGHGFRFKQIRMGKVVGSRSGSAFIAFDMLVGRRVAGPLHVKGGFTYGLAGDLHPFHPVVMFAWKPSS